MKYNYGLSIIIPCYNAEKTITKCLDSIPANSEIEIIIVDDCSSDDSIAYIEQYISKNKKNIILIKNRKNIGAGQSRNVGIKEAKNQYLTFLDSDDELSKDFISSILPYMNEGYDEIIFDATRVYDYRKSVLKMFFSDKIAGGRINNNKALVYIKGCTCGKVYKTEMIHSHGIQFGSMPRNEDMVFTKIATSYAASVYYIEKSLYMYNDNTSSLMNNATLINSKNAINAFEVVKSALMDRGLDKEINSLYFIEVLYSTTISNLRTYSSIAEVSKKYKQLRKKYKKSDPFFRGYNRIYKISFAFFELKAFKLYQLIRNYCKRKQRS